MTPKSLLLLCSAIMLSVSVSAQYTEKINTNRPGTSQGAFAVGNNVLQIEGGLGFGKEKHDILNTKTSLFNLDYALRYGLLWEQLELRLNGRFRADRVRRDIGGTEESMSRSNFEVNTIGAKYLFFDPYKRPKKDSIDLNSWKAQHKFKWKSLIPAMSIYVGANFISKDNPFTFEGDASISPRIVFATQNNWNTRMVGNWVLVTNIYIDKITTEDPVIGGIITSTHTLNDHWAIFGELQNQKSDFYSDHIMRLGGAYLWDKNLQLDANLAFNFKDTPSLLVFSFGASYRLDWHKKDEIIEQPGLEGGVKGEEEEENENEEIDGINIDEFRGVESDSLKYTKTPLINDFEDDDFREELERDLDERRTNERLERERIAEEKLSKKEEKKRRKEEKRRAKLEAKEAKAAEKARIKAEKDKQKMIDEIDAELDQIDKEEGKDSELDALDKELKKLEEEEKKFNESEKEEEEEEEEENIDEEYERYQEEQERAQKAEEKARKAEEKRRRKEEKKREKEEKKRQKELEKNSE